MAIETQYSQYRGPKVPILHIVGATSWKITERKKLQHPLSHHLQRGLVAGLYAVTHLFFRRCPISKRILWMYFQNAKIKSPDYRCNRGFAFERRNLAVLQCCFALSPNNEFLTDRAESFYWAVQLSAAVFARSYLLWRLSWMAELLKYKMYIELPLLVVLTVLQW